MPLYRDKKRPVGERNYLGVTRETHAKILHLHAEIYSQGIQVPFRNLVEECILEGLEVVRERYRLLAMSEV